MKSDRTLLICGLGAVAFTAVVTWVPAITAWLFPSPLEVGLHAILVLGTVVILLVLFLLRGLQDREHAVTHRALFLHCGQWFLTLFGSIWLLIEPIDLGSSNKPLRYLALLGASMVVAAATTRIKARGRKRRALSELFAKVRLKLELATMHANRYRREQNYYKLSFMNWRLTRELRKLSQIDTVEGYDLNARPPYADAIHAFGGIISSLGEGDLYLSISDLKFWTNVDFDGDSHFMEDNLLAAEGGAIIHRRIVIDRDILLNRKHPDRPMLTDIVRRLFKLSTEHATLFKKNLLFEFYVSADIVKDAGDPVPFALVQNSAYHRYLYVKPINLLRQQANVKVKMRFTADRNNSEFSANLGRFNALGRSSFEAGIRGSAGLAQLDLVHGMLCASPAPKTTGNNQ